MTDPMTPPRDVPREPTYLLISGGDGYSTQIIPASALDEAFIGLHYMPASECPADERKSMLDALHDPDAWEQRPRRYNAQYEDGYVEVIELSPNAAPAAAPAAMPPQEPLGEPFGQVLRDNYRELIARDAAPAAPAPCQTCGDQGRIPVMRQDENGREGEDSEPCPDCAPVAAPAPDVDGRRPEGWCQACGGSGHIAVLRQDENGCEGDDFQPCPACASAMTESELAEDLRKVADSLDAAPTGQALIRAAAFCITELRATIAAQAAQIARTGDELDRERVRVAACGVAAMQNTRTSADMRMKRDEWAWSDSYYEVCRAVDREIAERERAERAESDLAAARAECERMRAALDTLADFAGRLRTMSDEELRAWHDAARAATKGDGNG